jgi:hypothetical protein
MTIDCDYDASCVFLAVRVWLAPLILSVCEVATFLFGADCDGGKKELRSVSARTITGRGVAREERKAEAGHRKRTG